MELEPETPIGPPRPPTPGEISIPRPPDGLGILSQIDEPPDERAAEAVGSPAEVFEAGAEAKSSVPIAARAAIWLEQRGVGPATLIVLAIAAAALGATCLAVRHPGFGGILGTLAVLAAHIARSYQAPSALREDDAVAPFVAGISQLVPSFLAGGAVLDAAERLATPLVFVHLAVLGLFLWLPLLRSLDTAGRLPRGSILWSWEERAAVLVAGCLFGHTTLVAFILLVVLGADAMVRLALLRPRESGEPALPPALAGWLGPDGRPSAPVRYGSIVVVVLIVLLVGRESGWRF